MTAGFNSTTPGGYSQITEEYVNLTLKQKFTVLTPGGSGLANQAASGSFTVNNCVSPVVAFRTTGYVAIDEVTVNGSSWTFRVLHTGTSLEAYVFDYPTTGQTPGNFGLQVFRADGQLAFDSTMKYAKITDILAPSGNFPQSLGYPYNPNQTISVSATPGRTYAVAMAYMRSGSYFSNTDGFSDQYTILVDAVAISNNTATMATVKTGGAYFTDPGGGPGMAYYRQSQPPPILFFDVTGY